VQVRGKSGVAPYKTLQYVDDYSYSQFNFIIFTVVKTTRGVFPPLSEAKWLPHDPRYFCDFGIQASMEDVTVINLSIGGLELNIPNLQLSSLSVNVGQSECRRFRDDHCKFEWDGKSGFLPVVLSSVLTNRLHGRSQILV